MRNSEQPCPTFSARDHGHNNDGPWWYAVPLDRETTDFAHLLEQEVMIDGARWRCVGVQRFSHCAPWLQGERVGLLVRPCEGRDDAVGS